MAGILRLYALLLIVFTFPVSCFASDFLLLTDSMYEARISEEQMMILEDKDGVCSFEDIVSGKYDSVFTKYSSNPPGFNSFYWIKFTINNQTHQDKKWILQSSLHSEEIEMYIPTSGGDYRRFQTGQFYDFYNRDYKIRTITFDIPALRNQPLTYYAKVRFNKYKELYFYIGSQEPYTRKLVEGYIFLCFVYGFLFLMALYNFILYLSIKERIYIYYVIYALSAIFFLSWKDGLGFEIVWPRTPIINKYHHAVGLYFLVVTSLLYINNFLHLRKNHPLLHKITFAIIGLNSIYFIVDVLKDNYFDPLPSFYILTFIYSYGLVVYSIYKKYKPAIYLFIGLTCLVASLIVLKLRYIGVLEWSWFIDHILNYSLMVEVLTMSLAIREKLTSLKQEKELAQEIIIYQLRENEKLKDELNKELETKVEKRTWELLERNKQLDTILYKSSHDIKGPLRSMVGLINIALKDVKDNAAREYLEHLLKSAQRLETNVKETLSMIRQKEMKPEIQKIELTEVISQVLESFKDLPEYKRLKVDIDLQKSKDLYSDYNTIYSLVQNLIENAIKYQDFKKEFALLKIRGTIDDQVTLEFEDNGIGISKENINKIFDLFYKVNETSNGTGIGLHLVKSAIEKLGGSINVISKEGIGSQFRIMLKNNVHTPAV